MKAGWTCPKCGRWFGQRQAHFCAPPTTVDRWFKDRPKELRAIYDRVAKHFEKLGAVTEALNIGFQFKRLRTIAELRPRKAGFTLWFVVRRVIEDPRITRRLSGSGDKVYHFVVLTRPAEVDAQLRGWLTEAVASAEPPKSSKRVRA